MDRSNSRLARFRDGMPTSMTGKIGWILLWLLGVPIPVLFALFLLRGCT